ncbi:hypothetical protein PR048_006855 [Dryococelus australis]|uniref:Uncharacterized protein n=1 Tax=Dryococelus australis TaxID=614101 RepID=A0ABQ9IC38_9NEOP|nr:hypothetical protein PR048_006855 [Dryococelus australis]
MLRGRGDLAVRLLAPLPLPGLIPCRITPGFSHVRIVSDDAAGRRFVSGISCFPRSCIPALLHSQLISPSSALKNSRSSFKTMKQREIKGTKIAEEVPVPTMRSSRQLDGPLKNAGVKQSLLLRELEPHAPAKLRRRSANMSEGRPPISAWYSLLAVPPHFLNQTFEESSRRRFRKVRSNRKRPITHSAARSNQSDERRLLRASRSQSANEHAHIKGNATPFRLRALPRNTGKINLWLAAVQLQFENSQAGWAGCTRPGLDNVKPNGGDKGPLTEPGPPPR